MLSLGECVKCTWNQTRILNQTHLFHLKNCAKAEIIGFLKYEELSSKPDLENLTNKILMS